MILDRKYIRNGVYASLDFKIYQLVFEHNFSATSKCFNNVSEAKKVDLTGKFSLLYDLNNTKYLMKDNFRHFIIEYPELQLINAWKQANPPTDEPEVENQNNSIGFSPQITEAKMEGWGGLVRTQIPEQDTGVPVTYLDGTPGFSWWFYSIGILCLAPEKYLMNGFPAYALKNSPEILTTRVSLWCSVNNPPIQFKIWGNSCVCSIYNFPFIYLMYFIILS